MNETTPDRTNNPKPNDYSDIINLPRPISKTRPHMDKSARAAQFAPYAALVGHHDLIAHEEQIAIKKDNIDREITTELDPEIIAELELTEQLEIDTAPETEVSNFSQENPLDS